MKLKGYLKRFAPHAFLLAVGVFWVLILADKILLDVHRNFIIYGGVILCWIGFNLLSHKE